MSAFFYMVLVIAAYCLVGIVSYKAFTIVEEYYDFQFEGSEHVGFFCAIWPFTLIIFACLALFHVCIILPLEYVTPKVSKIEVKYGINLSGGIYPTEVVNFILSQDKKVIKNMYNSDYMHTDRVLFTNFLQTLGYTQRGDDVYVKLVFGKSVTGKELRERMKEAIK